MPIEHFAVKRVRRAAKNHPRAGLQFLARVHERIPQVVLEPGQQQALHRAAAGIARAQQSRRKDFGVVQHHQIARAKKIRKVRDGCVPNLARLSVEHQEA